jgi:hypothetical protein
MSAGVTVNDILKPIHHRRVPTLPVRPRINPTSHKTFRSYPTGRQHFSRACQGKLMQLTITMDEAIPNTILARLVTTLNANGHGDWVEIPFVRIDVRTLVCSIIPYKPGFHTFRAEFSVDGGVTWQRDNVPDAWVLVDPEHVEALRIYSLIPAISGKINDWKMELRRICEMGFNAVHLLPITTLDTSESPYSAKDLFSVEPSYLNASPQLSGLSQLEDFVEEARRLNIRLCFDLVLNHIGVNSKMANKAPDWIVPDEKEADGLQRAGYWSEKGWLPWTDLVLINYEHPSEMIRSEIWTYMTDYALFWAKLASATGGFIRFDNLHSGNADFMQSVTGIVHKEFPEVGFIAEYFTDERTLLRTTPNWRLNLILATPWNYRFVPQLRDYLTYIHRLAEQVRYFMPITSHDSGTPNEEFGDAESTVPRYVAAALLGTGATGITQGVEYGLDKKVEFIGHKPKMQFGKYARFGLFLGQVNQILVENPTFQHGGNCDFIDNRHNAIIAAFRRDPEGKCIGFLVICNFDISNIQSISIDLTSIKYADNTFVSHDMFSEEIQVHRSLHLEFHIPPCGVRVLKLVGNC